jgi:hypothetical protein
MTAFASGDIVTTPLGEVAQLVQRRGDGHWDALYLDCVPREAETVLQEKHIKKTGGGK